MYQNVEDTRPSGCIWELPPLYTPQDAARLALGRVRKVLTAYLPGMTFDPKRVQQQLQTALLDNTQEGERRFAQGWLAWLKDDPANAEPLLHAACEHWQQEGNVEELAQAAYWLARVRLLQQKSEAIAEFETVLRLLKGSAQGTAWFIDLLWRAGRAERAEQVWKSVRSNKRVVGCDEGFLLEARSLLRRGDYAAAEKVLAEARPGNGVLQVTRLLLQVWLAATQRHLHKIDGLMKQATGGPYPAAGLARWKQLADWRCQTTGSLETLEPVSPLLRDLSRGQQARKQGQMEEAVGALLEARSVAAAEPFARYALATLGHDDVAAVLALVPGLFLAVRCRLRQTMERFRNRQATPTELLEAVQQAANARYQLASAEHYRQLAQLLLRRDITPTDLQGVIDGLDTEASAARSKNLFRAVLEVAVRRLAGPDPAWRRLLVQWSDLPCLESNSDLKALLGRALLRLVLRERLVEGPVRDAVERLVPGEPLLGLLPRLAGEQADSRQGTLPALLLLQALRDPTTRQRLGEIGPGRWRGLALALSLQDAAERNDLARAAELLEDVEGWSGFRPEPPRFVVDLVQRITTRAALNPAWKLALQRWLGLWEPAILGPVGATLAAQAGLVTPGTIPEPPPGVPEGAWYLHLAVRSLGRGDAREALDCVRLVEELPGALEGMAENALVREAIPALVRRAHAQALAQAFASGHAAPVAPGVLVGLVDALQAHPAGPAILEAALNDDVAGTWEDLTDLLQSDEISPELLHHLALVELRAAQARENADQTDEADPHWQRSWQAWLRWLAATTPAIGPRLLDWLLEQHQQRVNDLLARNRIDPARRHWNLVQGLPGLADTWAPALVPDLTSRLERFRDLLASQYLVTTREAMRYGAIGEGMRADYDKGLVYLRRLLSLDHDSVRLLTALIEICGEYFLDLYQAGSPQQLVEQVERFLPFALQLIRLTENQSGQLTANAALAEFYKFRGFVTRDREQKVHLYREALRFNPANENVRTLLSEELENPPQEG